MGFVFIEANVKKWGLAPMTGSLAPPPPYGSEQGSILLESGRETFAQIPHRGFLDGNHSATSPGPLRSPTDISLAQLSHIPSHEDIGEGSSRLDNTGRTDPQDLGLLFPSGGFISSPPPEYSSPDGSRRNSDSGEALSEAGPRQHPPIPSYDAAVGNDRSPQYVPRRE